MKHADLIYPGRKSEFLSSGDERKQICGLHREAVSVLEMAIQRRKTGG